MKSRPTLADVAREVGVSVSTASRALADSPSVAPATKRKVEDAALRLGFAVNLEARALSTGRQDAIGLIVPNLNDPLSADLIKGAQRSARAAGQLVYVHVTGADQDAELGAIAGLRDAVDGFLLCAPHSSDGQLTDTLETTPAVVVYRHVPAVPSLVVEYTAAMTQVAEHLRSLGRTNVVHVAGPMQSWDAAARRLAFERAIDGEVLGPRTEDFDGGFAAADWVIGSGADAVVACNDSVALGIIARLRSRGVSVPDEVSVVGIDNTYLAVVAPSLTTINVPSARAAERAVSMLVDVVRGRHRHGHEVVVLPSDLIVRGTTGPISSKPQRTDTKSPTPVNAG